MKGKKKGLKIFLIILGAIVIIITGFVVYLNVGLDVKDAFISKVNISNLPDGKYNGEFTGSRFSNTLEVTVDGGKIVNIEILKDMSVVIPDLSNEIFNEVIAAQSLQVDAVAGATASTKAYLKSLEDALYGE